MKLSVIGAGYEAAQSADAVLLVTEWQEFREIDWNRLRSVVEHPLIVDGRNIFDAKDVTSKAFYLYRYRSTSACVSANGSNVWRCFTILRESALLAVQPRQQKSEVDSDHKSLRCKRDIHEVAGVTIHHLPWSEPH
jgi:UDP-glucose/GDP-mannose dehydrogenase family, UDP binding domain